MKYGVAGVAALLSVSATQALAQAQVRDAVYRGTLVCDKLPFFQTTSREALEVKISGSDAKYVLIVREGFPEAVDAQGFPWLEERVREVVAKVAA